MKKSIRTKKKLERLSFKLSSPSFSSLFVTNLFWTATRHRRGNRSKTRGTSRQCSKKNMHRPSGNPEFDLHRRPNTKCSDIVNTSKEGNDARDAAASNAGTSPRQAFTQFPCTSAPSTWQYWAKHSDDTKWQQGGLMDTLAHAARGARQDGALSHGTDSRLVNKEKKKICGIIIL